MVFDLTTPDGVWPELFIPGLGEHLVWAGAFASAVGHLGGLNEGQVKAGLAAYRPADLRQTVTHADGVTLIEDCYNAAPESMKAALRALALASEGKTNARRIAVLGDMKELGENTVVLHRAVGRLAAEGGIDRLITVGELGAEIARGALEAGMPPASVTVTGGADTYGVTADYLKSILRKGDHVLFKASRSMALERIAQSVSYGLQHR
jgi:UDP-N-acetylmuramoyl-tripeptide--D-alanyl-D-alanine ligase